MTENKEKKGEKDGVKGKIGLTGMMVVIFYVSLQKHLTKHSYMKKLLLFLVLAVNSLFALALSEDSLNAITMSSYEQRWIDEEGTISLKNNTAEQIHNIAFMLVYSDMGGKQLDYKEFSYEIEIAPGMTKSLDIPAFNHDKFYHYYKTPETLNNPTFKVDYKLQDYNIESNDVVLESSDDSSLEESLLESSTKMTILLFAIFLFGIGLTIALYILVAVLAKNRKRNIALWVALSVFLSPIIIIIILLIIGDEDNPKYS